MGRGDAVARAGRLPIRIFKLVAVALCLLLSAAQRPAAAQDIWLLVDTVTLELRVMRGQEVLHRYENISIGRGGAALDKQRNDSVTPLGEFHIVRVAKQTPFHRFFALDYPTVEHAGRALAKGRISRRQYATIRDAQRAGRIPPQDTPLGGYIGIHGVGEGDPGIHEDFNWTNGCIALSNAQIDDLNQWIRLGMRVIVR